METKLFDIIISTLTKEETLKYIYIWLYNNEKGYIATVNPEFLLLSQKDKEFKNILQNSKLNTADGIGLIWASWFLSTTKKAKNFLVGIYIFLKWIFSFIIFLFYKAPFYKIIKERIPGSELVYDITKIASNLNMTVFLLGGNDNYELNTVADKLGGVSIIADKDIGFAKGQSIYDENINNNLIEKINKSGAEIIFVAFGAPKQEKWIYNNLNKLNNIKLAIGIGGTFDFIAQYKRRAPLTFQKLGLEWLFRLIIEPKRWKRIFNAVVKFPIQVLKERM